jgi:hypothetical protein
MVKPKWRAREEIQGVAKNMRFFDCIISVFTYFSLASDRYKKKSLSALGAMLVADMCKQGRSRTALVETYLSSLEILLHGAQRATHEFHHYLLSLDVELRATMWKTQRLFAKDDNNPVANAIIAMKRMTVLTIRTTEQDARAFKILENFQRRAADFVTRNFEKLKNHHDRASLHRSSATTFFTRNQGGGAAEMHLTVGLYRLSKGIPSTLQDVWGHTPENLSMDDLLSIMDAQSEIRKEIQDACLWMLDELEKQKVSFPYLCIYPAREVKARCFMLLPYAIARRVSGRNDYRAVSSNA